MISFTNKISVVCIALFLSMALINCGGSKTMKKDLGSEDDAKGLYTKAIDKLIEKKYASSIKAVGMGAHPDKITAIKKARLDAKAQIARVFRDEISVLSKSFLEAVNEQKLEEMKETVEGFTNIELTGVQEAKAEYTEGKDGYTGYVLMVVSAETLKELIDQRTNVLTNFKALQAYKELEERVEKDKAARAAAAEM